MFACGDRVVYGFYGVCDIVAVEQRQIDRVCKDYFVLEPVERNGSKYYIPVSNPKALEKLQPILTKQELETLLSNPEIKENVWIMDESRRKNRYRELISSGNRLLLLQMIHSLHNHRKQQLESGRKFHLCDENFLKDAEKLLSLEFSLVLDLPQSEVAAYVHNALQII